MKQILQFDFTPADIRGCPTYTVKQGRTPN